MKKKSAIITLTLGEVIISRFFYQRSNHGSFLSGKRGRIFCVLLWNLKFLSTYSILWCYLIENGIPYDKSHDIRYLLVLLEEIPFTFEKQEALELLASTITDWEESSRYGKGVRTTVQTIQRVHNIYESMNQTFLKTQEKNNAEDGD